MREYQTNALYATTQYGYDLLDRLTTTTDNANNITTLTYDWLGRKTAMQDPDMGNWAYAYDNAGNLTQQRDARNDSVCFAYDALNRVTTKTARTGTSCASSPVAYTVTFGYDDTANGNKGLGRRTSLSDSSDVVHPRNTQTWQYDLQGRVVSTAQTIPGAPATYTTAFTYDAMDRVRTMTYPDGEVVTTSYNAQGLPDTLNGANSYVSATTYNAASQLDALTFGNSAVTDYVYNPNNLRLTDIVTTKSGNTLLNLHYNFDNVGNVLSVVDNARGETTNYSYDDLNRLLSASVTNGPNQYARSWQYDSIGNMTQRTEQGATTTYQYNDATSKHAVTHLNNVLKYAYDANGNMISRDGDTLAYDVENRLTSVTKAGVTTSFTYNGDGTRVKRSVSNAGTTYYIGNYFEVYVPNGGSATFNKFYYFGAQRVAAKIAGTLFYMQGDHLGSSSVVMTQAGTSFYSRQTYFPYGAPRTTEGSALPTDYTFTGQKNDDSTGLMFYGARYYDATLGRFTQPDTLVPNPLNPQSLNRFSYTLNNPVKYTDPTGHMELDPAEGTGGGNGTDGDTIYENMEEVVEVNENGDIQITPVETKEKQRPDQCKIPMKCAGGPAQFATPKVILADCNCNMTALWEFFDRHPSYDPATDPWLDASQRHAALFYQNDWAEYNARIAYWESQSGGAGLDGLGLGAFLAGMVEGASPYAKGWSKGTFASPEDNLQWHFEKYGGPGTPWKTPSQFTNAAQKFYNRNLDLAEPVLLKDGSEGLRIRTREFAGYYTLEGEIVRFGYRQK